VKNKEDRQRSERESNFLLVLETVSVSECMTVSKVVLPCWIKIAVHSTIITKRDRNKNFNL